MARSPNPEEPRVRSDGAPRLTWWQRIRDLALGLGLVAVGVVGLVLPVLPGWLAIIPGLLLLAGQVPPLRRAVNRVFDARPVRRAAHMVLGRDGARPVAKRVLRDPRVRSALEQRNRWRLLRELLPGRVESDGSDDDAGDS